MPWILQHLLTLFRCACLVVSVALCCLLLAVTLADHVRIALEVATTRRLGKETERGMGREGDEREEGRKGHTATAKCEGHHLWQYSHKYVQHDMGINMLIRCDQWSLSQHSVLNSTRSFFCFAHTHQSLNALLRARAHSLTHTPNEDMISMMIT